MGLIGISYNTLDKYKVLFKSETTSFVIGLVFLLCTIYLLMALTSFFFTGDSDQALLEALTRGDNSIAASQFKNYVGKQGAYISNYLINDCFGAASYFIVAFIGIAGLRMMGIRKFCVWKWFLGCALFTIWSSVFLAFITLGLTDSFIYWGGLHGYQVCTWMINQIGYPGVMLLLIFTAICFLIYFSTQTIMWIRSILTLKVAHRPGKKEKEDDDTFEDADGEEEELLTPTPEKAKKVEDTFSDVAETEPSSDIEGAAIPMEIANEPKTSPDVVPMTIEAPGEATTG